MVTPERIREAGEFVEWLRQSVHEQSLPSNNRVRAAGSCYVIAQNHHHAIVFLIGNRLYASSFALMRLAFEAYIRGIWMSSCATDAQIDKFLTKPNWEPPKINDLLSAVEKTCGFEDKILSYLKNHSWKALCSYTHTGGLQIQRWNTSDGIEPNYSAAEIESILSLSELVGAMSVIGIAELGNKDELALQVLDKIQKFN